MVNCSPNGSVLSHLLLITAGFFSSSFSLFLFFFIFRPPPLLQFFFFLFFLYSSINFFLPPLTSLPLKNLLRKLLTEERLDRREAWSVAGGALSLKTMWFLFLLYFFSLLKKAEARKILAFLSSGFKMRSRLDQRWSWWSRIFFEFLYWISFKNLFWLFITLLSLVEV